MLQLNIGAGQTYIPGFVNVDAAAYADVTVDLNHDKLPFDDDTVDLVFSYHTLEYFDNYLWALGEIHRVLKSGAPLLVGVPYVTLTYFNLVNPYHRQNFNESSFDFFDPEKLRGSAAEQATEAHATLFRKAFHRYHYLPPFGDLPPRERSWCRKHLFNTVEKIDFGLVTMKDETSPVEFNAVGLESRFDELLAARRLYGA